MSSGSDVAGQHEGIGHPRHHNISKILTPAVAGQGNAHQPGIETIRDIPAQDSLLDQDGPGRGRAFIVDIERSPPWKGNVPSSTIVHTSDATR